jgi:hypothetical protein
MNFRAPKLPTTTRKPQRTQPLSKFTTPNTRTSVCVSPTNAANEKRETRNGIMPK